MKIPVIDLFAGPGGLGEGFSSVLDKDGHQVFDVSLSIEKDPYAHETLELRSFFRQFPAGQVPEEYYNLLRSGLDYLKFQKRKELLFERFPEQSQIAKNHAWNVTLGKVPIETLDAKIEEGIRNYSNWVLIGGPPCQAYSVAGRVRNGGVDENDHRVYLYKEYLRIIAKHKPAIFVMENVKGLLSAKLNGESIFEMILDDLRSPSKIFPETESPEYKIFSLSTPPIERTLFGAPTYKKNSDYLIESENYGVPQKRHRVILLGIRQDLNVQRFDVLEKSHPVKLSEVIGDLPRLRSGLSRNAFYHREPATDNIKYRYENIEDSFENWRTTYDEIKQEILSVNGFKKHGEIDRKHPSSRGGEFMEIVSPKVRSNSELLEWLTDEKLGGVCNHYARPHMPEDLKRYFFAAMYLKEYNNFPRLPDYPEALLPQHRNAQSGKFVDRFRVQSPDEPATTITSHISKDGHYFIHYDPTQCRSLTVREAARVQTFPDNYYFCGPRTAQYVQVGNAVPPYLARQIAKVAEKIVKMIQ